MRARTVFGGATALVALALAVRPVAQAEEPFRRSPDLPFAIDHIALDLDVDLPQKSVAGTAAIDLHAVRDLTAIELDATGLEVSSVVASRSEKKTEPAKFATSEDHLAVSVELKRGDKARLAISYSVHDPKAGLHFYGPTPKDATVPYQVYSQGEARTNHYWFPCIDSPCLKQTTEITAHVAPGYEALSNGKLAEKKDENGKTVFHWVQEKPHVSYLVTLVVGKFFVGKDEWRGKPVLYYVPEKNKDDVARSFADTPKMLEFFSTKIGVEYAWPKYAQVVVEQFGWGGMENTSATTLNDYTLHDQRAHLDFESDGLVAHELAHQWWGDLLTCRDWAHIWLNEGFATYFEALWDENKNGADAFEYNMYQKSHGARSEVCKRRPIVDHYYADAENVFDDRNYPKGSWVLHGLRRRVGDECFWRAINRYAKAHLYQNVETIDLRRAFEEESGESLERYFHDMTERPGHPAIEVSYEWHAEDKLLEVHLKQTQQGDPYAFRSAVAYGNDPSKPSELKRVPISIEDEKEKRLYIPVSERPAYVRFDPEEGVLKDLVEHKDEEQWLLQVSKDAHPIGRIRAAHQLADHHNPRATAAIAKQLMEDKEWFVSIECAQALAKAGGDQARDGLIAAIAHANPRVRRVVVEQLANFRTDEKAIAAIRPIVQKGDPSYFVEAQAVQALAQLRAPDAREWLEKALQRPSHNDVIAEHAINGLASLEDPLVLPTLEKAALEQGNLRKRRAAISSLARVAALPATSSEARQKTVTLLGQLVTSEGMRLKHAAIDGLGALGKEAVSTLALLESVQKADGEGRIRDAAKNAADRIRAGTPPDKELARVRDELARVRDEEEKILRRLEKVEGKGSSHAGPSNTPAPEQPKRTDETPASRQPD